MKVTLTPEVTDLATDIEWGSNRGTRQVYFRGVKVSSRNKLGWLLLWAS